MGTLMAILGIMNGIKTMQAGNKLGGALGVLGTVNQAGWFNKTLPIVPEYHSFGESDSGVRRNFQ